MSRGAKLGTVEVGFKQRGRERLYISFAELRAQVNAHSLLWWRGRAVHPILSFFLQGSGKEDADSRLKD